MQIGETLKGWRGTLLRYVPSSLLKIRTTRNCRIIANIGNSNLDDYYNLRITVINLCTDSILMSYSKKID